MISKFPVFTGKIEHEHSVYQAPFSRAEEGRGDEARAYCRQLTGLATEFFEAFVPPLALALH